MIVIVQRVKWIVKLTVTVKLNAPFCQIDNPFGKMIGITETKRLFCETTIVSTLKGLKILDKRMIV